MHRSPASFLSFEWLGEIPQKSGCQLLEDPSSSSAFQLSMLHVVATQLQWLQDAAGYFLLFHIPPKALSFPGAVRYSSPSLFLWSLLPDRFRKPKVLSDLPLLINSEDQSKTTKMETKKTLALRSLWCQQEACFWQGCRDVALLPSLRQSWAQTDFLLVSHLCAPKGQFHLNQMRWKCIFRNDKNCVFPRGNVLIWTESQGDRVLKQGQDAAVSLFHQVVLRHSLHTWEGTLGFRAGG